MVSVLCTMGKFKKNFSFFPDNIRRLEGSLKIANKECVILLCSTVVASSAFLAFCPFLAAGSFSALLFRFTAFSSLLYNVQALALIRIISFFDADDSLGFEVIESDIYSTRG